MGRSPPIQGGRLESVSYLAVEQPLEAAVRSISANITRYRARLAGEGLPRSRLPTGKSLARPQHLENVYIWGGEEGWRSSRGSPKGTNLY